MADRIGDRWMGEAVLDKGHHSRQALLDLEEMDVRSYASEPGRGRQKWAGQRAARDAVCANRRRIKGERGKRLLRSRGEKLERAFAHCYETGGMRRLHLRGRENVAKRVLVHAAAFNVGPMMRLRRGLREPRSLTKAAGAACALSFEMAERLAPIVGVVRLIVANVPSRLPLLQRNPSPAAA